MPIHYKVVELKGQRDPALWAGDTPEVTAEDIETALNQQGHDNWELFTILERFTETSQRRTAAMQASAHPHSSIPRASLSPSFSRRSWHNLLYFPKRNGHAATNRDMAVAPEDTRLPISLMASPPSPSTC